MMSSGTHATDGLIIRTMRRDEIALAVDWAASEGWNPGLSDAACFAMVDPHGFLLAERDGAPVATVSCVNYDEHFAFLGFYIVRPDMRGQGYGVRLWQAAMGHAGSRVVGLDGVVAQQDNYRRSGFSYAYANVRYGGKLAGALPVPADGNIVPLVDMPLSTIEASDAAVFPAPRRAFLQAWIASPGHVGRALIRDGALAAWGVIRPCRTGYKIGPLIADLRGDAEAVLSALLTASGAAEVFIDVPAINPDAVALAESLGLASVFETARMYTGPIPPLRMERVFGVTTFELG
jgi:GNAT superfamily N-acetyltransferase